MGKVAEKLGEILAELFSKSWLGLILMVTGIISSNMQITIVGITLYVVGIAEQAMDNYSYTYEDPDDENS